MGNPVRCGAVVITCSFVAAATARADDPPPLRHAPVIDDVLLADAQLPEMTPDEQAANARERYEEAVTKRLALAVAEAAAADKDSQDAPLMPRMPTEPPPEPSIDHRPGIDHELEAHRVGEVGLRVGGSRIDGVDGGVVTEILAAAGVHLDRVTLLGEYGLSLVHHDATGNAGRDGTSSGGTDTDQTTGGVMHRLGGVVRYAFWRAKSDVERKDHDQQGVGEFYVQGGGGAEIIHWDLGGRLVRPEASVGIGVLGAHRSSAHRRNGWFAGFKVQVARRIDDDGAAPTCAAPCTTATPPVAWSDRSYLFETGFLFGN